MLKAQKLLEGLTRFKLLFTFLSAGYCVVHWFTVHNFSLYVLLGSLVFGLTMTMAATWLSGRLASPSEESVEGGEVNCNTVSIPLPNADVRDLMSRTGN